MIEQETKQEVKKVMDIFGLINGIAERKNQKDLQNIILDGEFRDEISKWRKNIQKTDFILSNHLGTSHICRISVPEEFFKLLLDSEPVEIDDARLHIKLFLIGETDIYFVVFQISKKIFITKEHKGCVDGLLSCMTNGEKDTEETKEIKKKIDKCIEYCDIRIVKSIEDFESHVNEINFDQFDNQFIIINQQTIIPEELKHIYKNMGNFVDLEIKYVSIKKQKDPKGEEKLKIQSDLIMYMKCSKFQKLSPVLIQDVSLIQDVYIIRYLFHKICKLEEYEVEKLGKIIFLFYYWCKLSNINSDQGYFTSPGFNARLQFLTKEDKFIIKEDKFIIKKNILSDRFPEETINGIKTGIERAIFELDLDITCIKNRELGLDMTCAKSGFKKSKTKTNICDRSTDHSGTEDEIGANSKRVPIQKNRDK